MFQVVQPMQTVTVDGQEALFIPNMGAQANQLNGAQPIQIGNQQAFITPNGQIIRAPNVMPANILQNMGQTVSLPTGKFNSQDIPSYIPHIPYPIHYAYIGQVL